MKREKDVKDRVKQVIKEVGGWYTMPFQMGMNANGVPDILACINGYFVAIECKFGKNTPSPLQQMQLDAIKNARGFTLVCNDRNIDNVASTIRALADGSR